MSTEYRGENPFPDEPSLADELAASIRRAVELEARAEKVEAEVERLRGEVERVEGARARAAQSGLAMVEKAEREVERLRSALDTANATNRELLSKRDGHLAALARAREVLRGLVDLYGSAGTDQIRAAMKVLEEDP